MARYYTRRRFLKISAASALAAYSFLTPSCSLFADFDLLIIGGTIYDGSGQPEFLSDLGIKNGRIAAMGELKDGSAGRKIDATGLAVAPGFIDFHSHSDDELLLGGDSQSKIRQGVTTEILGQDGDSMAPLNQLMFEDLRDSLWERYRIKADWKDFSGYFRELKNRDMITNALSMVGQGTLRQYVVGEDDRPATSQEIEQMKELARAAFAQGAFGVSSGLEYTPGSFATTEEIIEVCKSMNGHGIYSTHMRNEDDTVLEALQEAIDISRGAGVSLNISHIKSSGKRNWHKLPAVLAMLDEARGSGIQVTCDRYPYVAYNTGLSSLFPLWSRDGGDEKFVSRLQDPALSDSLRSSVMEKIDKIGGWQSVMISSLSKNPDRQKYEGKQFQELSRDGTDPFALLVDLVVKEEGGGDMVGFAMSEENTAKILAYPNCIIASDASGLAIEGALRRGNPHPRAFGTFPRVLGKYVRDEGIMNLTEAVRKMTSLPATTIGLKDRGYLRKDYWADIVIFDPKKVIDNATWANPHQYPSGIPYVIVNGQLIIDQENFTGELAGEVLRIA
jgi:N-acyl-D-amino-acid deacylase